MRPGAHRRRLIGRQRPGSQVSTEESDSFRINDGSATGLSCSVLYYYFFFEVGVKD